MSPVRSPMRPMVAVILAAGLVLGGCNGDSSGAPKAERGMFGPGGWANGVPVDGEVSLGPGGPDPDLSVTGLLAPHTVLLGSALLMDLTVSNGGAGIAPTQTPWKLYRDTPGGLVQVGAGNLGRIDPGAKEKVSVTLDSKGMPLGELVLCFVIDPTDLVDESDEGNNQREVRVQVVQVIDN